MFSSRIAAILRAHITDIDRCTSPTADKARYDQGVGIARDLAAMFKRDNPRFNAARFFAACGLEEYQ